MLSVIIPTRNRVTVLLDALEAIRRQTLATEKFEVLVIDNGSTDGTAAAVDALAVNYRMRRVLEPEPGLHAARHRGLREAACDRLVFADDDIIPEPSWLEAIQQAFEDPQVVMVGGNNLPAYEADPPEWIATMWSQSKDGVRSIPYLSIIEREGPLREVSPFSVYGCNLSVRRATVLEAKGFHPDAMPRDLIRYRGDGETHISRYVAESGGKCLFHPAASVRHRVSKGRMTGTYFRQRAFDQGISDSYTAFRSNPTTDLLPDLRQELRYVRRLLSSAISLPGQHRDIQISMANGYHAGYREHRSLLRHDPGLRAWVTRPTYL